MYFDNDGLRYISFDNDFAVTKVLQPENNNTINGAE